MIYFLAVPLIFVQLYIYLYVVRFTFAWFDWVFAVLTLCGRSLLYFSAIHYVCTRFIWFILNTGHCLAVTERLSNRTKSNIYFAVSSIFEPIEQKLSYDQVLMSMSELMINQAPVINLLHKLYRYWSHPVPYISRNCPADYINLINCLYRLRYLTKVVLYKGLIGFSWRACLADLILKYIYCVVKITIH